MTWTFLRLFLIFLIFFNLLSVFSSHVISQNDSYDDLALYDINQTIFTLEDGLDEWHEKNVRYYVDPRYRILAVSSVFDQDTLKGGGFVFYAFSKIEENYNFFFII